MRAGSPLSVTDYDPSRFEDYRKALVASRDFDRTARIQTWLDHWRAEGRGVEALLAVVRREPRSTALKMYCGESSATKWDEKKPSLGSLRLRKTAVGTSGYRKGRTQRSVGGWLRVTTRTCGSIS